MGRGGEGRGREGSGGGVRISRENNGLIFPQSQRLMNECQSGISPVKLGDGRVGDRVGKGKVG